MQSATSRLNSIIMFTATVLLTASIVNHLHGRFLLYNPQAQIQFNNIVVTQFRNTTLWEQLSFKYDLKASIYVMIYRFEFIVYMEFETIVCVYRSYMD